MMLPVLATFENILDAFIEDLERAGVVGEERPAKLVYLAVSSRVLKKPISLAIKGPSSVGKSHSVEKALERFPDDAFYALSAMSERALAYSKVDLRHRMFVVYEAAGLSGEFASYLMRSLLSEEVSRLTHFSAADITIAIVLAVLATTLAGLYPTWRAAQVQPAWQLKAQ